MKKYFSLILILSLIVGACSNVKKEAPVLTKSELISLIQKNVKKTNSLTVHGSNTTTIVYDKFTTKFSQETDSMYDSVNQSALKIIPQSNHTKYPVKSIIFNMDNGNVEAFPAPTYLNYRARNSDINYFSSLQSNIVNQTDIVQNVLKKNEDALKVEGDKIKYSGKSKSLLELFDYGTDFSGMNQTKTFSDIKNLKVISGDYEIDLSKQKKMLRSISFNIKITGMINDKPVTIQMKQHTKYTNINETDVVPYKPSEIKE